jgi:hypothetical protein
MDSLFVLSKQDGTADNDRPWPEVKEREEEAIQRKSKRVEKTTKRRRTTTMMDDT